MQPVIMPDDISKLLHMPILANH